MSNPVLVEVLRGELVESRHRGAVAVSDAEGRLRLAIGDVGALVFPRSAVKAIQAIPLIESGAAAAFGYQTKELALACASHNGEPAHIETAADLLARAGLTEDALACGPQAPRRAEDAAMLARTGGAPRRIHNNCSGKHAGFLALAAHQGWPIAGYETAEHPVQQAVRDALETLTGRPLTTGLRGTDGCSIPTYAAPLDRLALAFARLTTGAGLSPDRAAAAKRLEIACMTAPFMVAGTDRFCTNVMRACLGGLFAKTGAEGVFCATLPDEGLGIALKCDDGATRGAEAMMAAVAAALLPRDAPGRAEVAALATRAVTNWDGAAVGQIRPAGALTAALAVL